MWEWFLITWLVSILTDENPRHKQQSPPPVHKGKQESHIPAPRFSVLSGHPHVVDAETLAFVDGTVKLEGVDAPEPFQTCQDALDRVYQCGAAATAALRTLIMGQAVTCSYEHKDRFGRALGICHTGQIDLAAWLVENGYAVTYRTGSEQYQPQENIARRLRKGIWQGAFIRPWHYRRGKR